MHGGWGAHARAVMKAPDSSLWFATDRGSDVLHNLAIKSHRFSRSNWLSSPTAIGSSHQPIAQASRRAPPIERRTPPTGQQRCAASPPASSTPVSSCAQGSGTPADTRSCAQSSVSPSPRYSSGSIIHVLPRGFDASPRRPRSFPRRSGPSRATRGASGSRAGRRSRPAPERGPCR